MKTKARGVAFLALLALVSPVMGDDDADVAAGMEAAVRGRWVDACEAFRKVKGDPRTGSRLTAARKQLSARLGPAIVELMRRKAWGQLAEAAACGLAADPNYHRYRGAAKRLEKEGVKLPPLDARLRAWGTYGQNFGEARLLIEDCLDYLVKTQEAEGHWDCDKHGGGALFDAGVTGLALLALAPHRPKAADRAAAALLRQQDDKGNIGTMATHSWIYGHSFATEALAEYALLTGKTESYRAALQRAVGWLAAAQNPGKGWRYLPRGEENDTCVTVRVICAMAAAQRAGADVDRGVFNGARTWVASMTDPNFGQIGYNYPGGSPSRAEGRQDAFPVEHSQAMSAAGCVVHFLAGSDPLAVAKSVACVHQMLPQARYPDMYYWDLGARACVGLHGQIPARWYRALVKSAAACRGEGGGMRACGPWGDDGGQIYATAMCALALSAPYRVVPSRKPNPAEFLKTRKRVVQVPGMAWAAATGIYVDSGMALEVESRGAIVPFDKGPRITPDGVRRKLSKPLVRGAPFGCLLGQIDNGKPFVIVPGKKTTMRGFGHLWLLVNDYQPSDNHGSWDITIQLH